MAFLYSCFYLGVFLLTRVTLLFRSCSCRSFSRLNHVLKQLIQQKKRAVPVLFSELKRRAAELYVRCYVSTLKCNKCIGVYHNLLYISDVRLSRPGLIQKSTMQTNINRICLHSFHPFFLYCSFTRQINCVMLPCRCYNCYSVCGSVVPTISLIKSYLVYV